MKIPTPCPDCFIHEQKQAELEKRKVSIVMLPGRMTDAGYIEVKCPNGHSTTVVYDDRKFELLFQSACHTLNDGYEREAVSSFAASLERLYEFYIRVSCRRTDISEDVLGKTWKLMSRQSERQFGCFLMQYAMHAGETFKFDQKQIEFRNKVIHQGYIPNHDEVLLYGREAWRIKIKLYRQLERDFPEELNLEIKREIEEIKSKVPGQKPPLVFKAMVVNVDTHSNIGHDIEVFEQFLGAMKLKWNKNT